MRTADGPAAPRGTSRPSPMWLLVIAALLLVVRIGVTVWEERHPPVARELVEWVAPEDAAFVAAERGRPILYDFTAEWCPPCQAMNRELFGDEKHARFVSESFVPVRVLDRQREEGRNSALVDSLQRAYAITGFPTLVVVDAPSGRHRSTSGFMGAFETVRWLGQSALAVRMPAPR